jgi:group II intron reverse transcriptase/maturase
LEPEWEARFEPKSYGFRPGRGCHDAIAAIYVNANGKSPKRTWALDADLASAFDKLAHNHLVQLLGTFPTRGMVKQWLTAGVVEHGHLSPTEEGVPQGGVISPVLLNIALHGMEQAAGVRYHLTGTHAGWAKPGSPLVIRYADDLIALCHTRQQAVEVKARLASWLAPRGLVFNEDKTRIVTLAEGFDFLGFNVRRYHGKLLIKPSKAAIRRIRERLRTEMRSLRGTNVSAVLRTINPIIRGWSAYYRGAVSKETFSALDTYMWRLTYKWATYSHSNKSKCWVVNRYFGRFNRSREGRWGVRRPRQRRLPPEVRLDADRPTPARDGHSVARRPRPDRVLGRTASEGATPDDRHGQLGALPAPARPLPVLRGLAPARRRHATHPTPVGTMARHHAQDDHPRQPPERHVGQNPSDPHPLSPPAHRRRTANSQHASASPASHQGLLEPCAGKPARTVLTGAGRSNASGLPEP